MYRKYYSYNDMPKPYVSSQEKNEVSKINEVSKKNDNNKILGKFEIDDIVILIVVVMLLANDCNDKLLLLALAFIFLTDFDGFNFF